MATTNRYVRCPNCQTGATDSQFCPEFAQTAKMTSEKMVSVSPIWQLGHVEKAADTFAKVPIHSLRCLPPPYSRVDPSDWTLAPPLDLGSLHAHPEATGRCTERTKSPNKFCAGHALDIWTSGRRNENGWSGRIPRTSRIDVLSPPPTGAGAGAGFTQGAPRARLVRVHRNGGSFHVGPTHAKEAQECSPGPT